MNFQKTIVILLLIVTLFSCSKKKKLFTNITNSGINFTNTIKEVKDLNVFNYRNFYNGGGVATGDLNNDGLLDVFLTANQGPNKLYLNKGDFRFEDVSTKAGFAEKKQWSTGVVFVDINNDKWLDIYVCNAGNVVDSNLRKNQLFINNQNLTFTEKAVDYGLDDNGYSTQASFFDYDLDGDLDCFLVNNSPIPVNTLNYANKRDVLAKDWDLPNFLKGGGDHLFQNNNGKFAEVTKEAGLHGSLISLGLGVNVGDVNEDGYPDVYVSNDFFERDYLYINQKNGTFKDELENDIQHTSLSSMGADMQDVNNDGLVDIFTTDMLPDNDYRLKTNTSFENYDIYSLKQRNGFYNQFTQNALQINSPNHKFTETAFYSGVAASDWSWGSLLFDADNDGNNDIYISNGIYKDVTDQDFIDFFGNDVVQEMTATGKKMQIEDVMKKMPSVPIKDKFFKNNGNLKFSDEGENWGIEKPSFSNGAAYADFDNDGDLDLIVNTVNQATLIYKNNANELLKNNYITIQLNYISSNHFAIGATISVYQKDKIFSRQIMPSRGFQSSVDYGQTIGLGTGVVDSIKILWPNRTKTVLQNIGINKKIIIDFATAKKDTMEVTNTVNTLFDSIPNIFDKHIEDEYVDYYVEKTVPYMLSKLGPKATVGDVNGDLLEDIFIGGAKNQSSKLYIQTANGFRKKNSTDFNTFSINDVTSAFFFDVDNDKDLDLFVGGGGNFSPATQPAFLNQLFINDGKGDFTLKRGALPSANVNCGPAFTFDYDSDGFLDIFTTPRSSPQNYGANASCTILHNNNGINFTDITEAIAPVLKQVGMITGANYVDVDGDKKNELLLVGEWMSPNVFSFDGKQFLQKENKSLTNINGMWQTMQLADLDKDGDMDIVLGNMGENQYINATINNPIKLWLNDFDNNGTPDKIFSKTIDGKDFSVFTKREITDQIPSLKKENLLHHDFGKKTIQDLFKVNLKNATKKTCNYAASCILWNDGKANFTITNMPWQVQLSSVNAIAVEDINKDGWPDLIMGGNMFDMLPQFARLDASYGHVLINNKNKGFDYLPNYLSGIYCKGQVKDIATVTTAKGKEFIFLQNNDYPMIFKLK
jgi:enediyne biosynthesis protein E4